MIFAGSTLLATIVGLSSFKTIIYNDTLWFRAICIGIGGHEGYVAQSGLADPSNYYLVALPGKPSVGTQVGQCSTKTNFVCAALFTTVGTGSQAPKTYQESFVTGQYNCG